MGRASSSDRMVTDPRNDLYRLYQMVLEHYKSEMFIFENVPGLLTAKKGFYLEQIHWVFKDSGYELKYRILNARFFNVLQNRKRVILIGWKKGTDHRYPEFHEEEDPKYSVSVLLNGLSPLEPGGNSDQYLADPSEYLINTGIRTEDDILTWHGARPNIERDRDIYRYVIKAWGEGHKRGKYTDLPKNCVHIGTERLFLTCLRWSLRMSIIPRLG